MCCSGKTALSALPVLAFVGLLVAAYALYVEHKHDEAAAAGLAYTAACDFGPHASCSTALTSKYGKVLSLWGLVPKGSALDVPNAALGSVFYALVLLFPYWRPAAGAAAPSLLLAGSVASLAFSLYLAYVLRFILHDFCIVCFSAYVVNTAVFAAAVSLFRAAGADAKHARPARAAPRAPATTSKLD